MLYSITYTSPFKMKPVFIPFKMHQDVHPTQSGWSSNQFGCNTHCNCLFVWFYWSDNRWEIYHHGCVGDLEFNRLGRFLTLKSCQGQFQIGAGSKSRCQDFLDWKKFRLPTMTSSDHLSYDQKGLVRIYSGTDCTKLKILRTGSK